MFLLLETGRNDSNKHLLNMTLSRKVEYLCEGFTYVEKNIFERVYRLTILFVGKFRCYLGLQTCNGFANKV